MKPYFIAQGTGIIQDFDTLEEMLEYHQNNMDDLDKHFCKLYDSENNRMADGNDILFGKGWRSWETNTKTKGSLKDIQDDIRKHKCLQMTLEKFTELIETLTDGLKTVKCEFGVYITDTNKTLGRSEYLNRDVNDILSEHLGLNVISWHADMNGANRYVWIIYDNAKKTGMLSYEQIKIMQKNDGMIKGVISVDLHECINLDLEGFLDLISERLTGSLLLSNSDYKLIDMDGDCLLFEVTGDAGLILESE